MLCYKLKVPIPLTSLVALIQLSHQLINASSMNLMGRTGVTKESSVFYEQERTLQGRCFIDPTIAAEKAI